MGTSMEINIDTHVCTMYTVNLCSHKNKSAYKNASKSLNMLFTHMNMLISDIYVC